MTVHSYHDQSKHHLDRYARSPGFMDWANQPDPFRRFEGAPLLRLELPAEAPEPTYDSLFTAPPAPRPLTRETVSELFFYSLALSAWKQVRGPGGTVRNRWSLRVDPSSGNLHPTEAYLICGPVEGLSSKPAVYHYAPFEHGLELRRELEGTPGLPDGAALIGLSSIHWREAWKYGERAFRYCQHDCGHVIAAVALSAACLGWSARLIDSIPSGQLARLLGVHLQKGVEREHADCLLLLTAGPPPPDFSPEGLIPPADTGWLGEPNQLSAGHRSWSVIDEVSAASESPGYPGHLFPPPAPPPPAADRGLSAHRIIRQRRSAVAMDGETSISSAAFYRMLGRLMPQPVPAGVLPWRPSVSLILFLHRVEGLAQGLYALVRDPSHEQSLRASLRSDFLWERPAGCSRRLPLYLLVPTDTTEAARTVSCHQDIASDGVFTVSMLARFDDTLSEKGPAMYPRLFWETGLVGQVLYLEAEAAGIRGTGIGCFFDDALHRTIGIEDHSWQSLYHFTLGGPIDDPRLQTLDAYAHLEARRLHGDDAWRES